MVDGTLVPRAAQTQNGTTDEVRISHTIAQAAFDRKRAVLSRDASNDELFSASQSVSEFGIRSVMCGPLLAHGGRVLGVLQIYSEEGRRPFSVDDLEILVTVSTTTALALENLGLHADVLASETLRRELDLARDVQQRFLPVEMPCCPGYEFHGIYEAAHWVGGDYYGFQALPDGRLAISIGDVSGKGMPAAMLMARLSSDVRYALLAEATPGSALQSVNHSLTEAGITDKFVTLLLMALDPTSHSIVLANAGHLPALVKRRDRTVIEAGGGVAGYPLLVNLGGEESYRSETMELGPGDTVVAFTDGVVEAKGADGSILGIERLTEIVRGAPGDPRACAQAVLAAVERFATAGEQSDRPHTDQLRPQPPWLSGRASK